MAASYQTVAVLRLAPRLAKAEEHPPRGLGGLSGLLHGSMVMDAPAEALGFDAPGSILGLTRGGRARGVKSVPRGGAQAGDQRRSSSSSRLTSAVEACRMRPVGVETDSLSPRSCSRPGLMFGVSTGSMVEGFVVSGAGRPGGLTGCYVLVQAVRAQKLQARAASCPVMGSRAVQDDAGVGKPRWSAGPVLQTPGTVARGSVGGV